MRIHHFKDNELDPDTYQHEVRVLPVGYVEHLPDEPGPLVQRRVQVHPADCNTLI